MIHLSIRSVSSFRWKKEEEVGGVGLLVYILPWNRLEVDYAEVVQESGLAHCLLVEATHTLVLTRVLVGNEPVVHVSAWHFVELPAE